MYIQADSLKGSPEYSVMALARTKQSEPKKYATHFDVRVIDFIAYDAGIAAITHWMFSLKSSTVRGLFRYPKASSLAVSDPVTLVARASLGSPCC